MFEHIDEEAEKRELMRSLARAVLKIDDGQVGMTTDERLIGKACDGVAKLIEMLKDQTAATPATASAELQARSRQRVWRCRQACEDLLEAVFGKNSCFRDACKTFRTDFVRCPAE